jgi:cAMP phosphodiesterase
MFTLLVWKTLGEDVLQQTLKMINFGLVRISMPLVSKAFFSWLTPSTSGREASHAVCGDNKVNNLSEVP